MKWRSARFPHPRGWLCWLARTSAIAAAVLLTVGLGTAGWAAPAQPPRATGAAAPGPATTTGNRPADESGIECFYVYPSCSSSDPSVQILIENTGDTTVCTFEFTISWGDGNSDTQTFDGIDGAGTIATFNHTYDNKPDSYPVTVTGQVVNNTDPSEVTCTANGGNYTFNLTPAAGLAALRFAAAGADPLTPGVPVIKDNGPHTKVDDLSGPDPCDGVDDPMTYDYLACQSPVPALDGPSAKDWPVIYPAGSPLSINEAVFIANGPITDPVLTANASIPGSGIFPDLFNTPMKEKKVGDVYQLTATKLKFGGDTLPAVVGRDGLAISWTITDSKTQAYIAAGDEHFTVYVTDGTYVPAAGAGASQVAEPYESLLDVGTEAAAGKSGELAVFNAIWKTFATRQIAHPQLDTVTGGVTYGPTFQYYDDAYGQIADWFNAPIGGCPTFTKFLADNSGHCGNFAEFLAGVLAFQGISAEAIGLGDPVDGFYPGFYPGPDPAKNLGPANYTYMLVGPGLWKFGKKKNAPTNYPYRDNLTVGPHNRIIISGSGVSYSSTKPIAQGPVTDPPMLFATGDHAIVKVSLTGSDVPEFVDPSYGNPQGTPDYITMPDYEKTAIAGFAVIYKKVGSQLFPLKDTGNPFDVATACKHKPGQHIACYFQAVPYK
jgi:hypothetical protein